MSNLYIINGYAPYVHVADSSFNKKKIIKTIKLFQIGRTYELTNHVTMLFTNLGINYLQHNIGTS
jgi:hypothetical protein